MPGPQHRRRRGRRPPDRLSARYGRAGATWSHGFTPPGLSTLHRLLMPSLRGPEKKAYFNRLSGCLAAGLALGGAALGYSWVGPVGLILGGAAGACWGGSLAERHRFFRR